MRLPGVIAAAMVLLAGIWMWQALRLQPLPPQPLGLPQARIAGQRTIVTSPGACLVAEIGRYQDELFAYLVFDHFRHAEAPPGTEALLTYRSDAGREGYTLLLHFKHGDLAAAISRLVRMQFDNVIPGYDWHFAAPSVLWRAREQTRFFVTAYNLPVRRRLEGVPPVELSAYTGPFVRFKSVTDKRVRMKIEPVPSALSSAQAHRLAGDIVAVADFYELPLDSFLGIGAMENNYMNVMGDLSHATWKRRAAPGDVVLSAAPRTGAGAQRGAGAVADHQGVPAVRAQALSQRHTGLYPPAGTAPAAPAAGPGSP